MCDVSASGGNEPMVNVLDALLDKDTLNFPREGHPLSSSHGWLIERILSQITFRPKDAISCDLKHEDEQTIRNHKRLTISQRKENIL